MNSTPSDDDVKSLLESEYGGVLKLEKFERVNGMEYPGGNGQPASYEVKFNALFSASDSYTLTLYKNMERVMSGCAKIKTVSRGHLRQNFTGFTLTQEEYWRGDQTRVPFVNGTVLFVKTEKGWQKQEMTVCLDEGMVPHSYI